MVAERAIISLTEDNAPEMRSYSDTHEHEEFFFF